MERDNIQFSKQQLEYLRKRYNTAINHSIIPGDTLETIMYHAGVRDVISHVAALTVGGVPDRPR